MRKFFVTDGSGCAKRVIICGAGMSSSAHVVNEKKVILIHGKDPADGLNDTTLTAEKEHYINFTEQQKKFGLSLHYI